MTHSSQYKSYVLVQWNSDPLVPDFFMLSQLIGGFKLHRLFIFLLLYLLCFAVHLFFKIIPIHMYNSFASVKLYAVC